ncbi:hypothetical protein [Mucilaginibacter myungsuensis]|uniref:Outer membrane protein with beta-barrel domain n=1 Tax=Mucilaginibacter myungsuensis TaxID=649104 RepID=A0A929PX52_9SPHI|nr:hypothetical protein [Mucilaginibacter myungsuensis]MBE9661882.1 hypothetical protein [Mucilaginibacter myungsuensis]MDN3599684.1 hypothetical protein [Mucilaginibacter myungsuensis]
MLIAHRDLISSVPLITKCFKGANTSSDSRWRLGIGVEATVPTSNYLKYTTGFGMGITPRLQYAIGECSALTFTSGYYNFFGKRHIEYNFSATGYTFREVSDAKGIVPVKLGIKTFLSSKIYVAGEAGAAFETFKYGNTKADLAASVGYAKNAWDIGAKYEHLIGEGSDNYGFAGLRVAYSFGL